MLMGHWHCSVGFWPVLAMWLSVVENSPRHFDTWLCLRRRFLSSHTLGQAGFDLFRVFLGHLDARFENPVEVSFMCRSLTTWNDLRKLIYLKSP